MLNWISTSPSGDRVAWPTSTAPSSGPCAISASAGVAPPEEVTATGVASVTSSNSPRDTASAAVRAEAPDAPGGIIELPTDAGVVLASYTTTGAGGGVETAPS